MVKPRFFRRTLTAALLGSLAGAALAQQADHEEHGAHVHGIAQLTVALEGQQLAIELSAPAADIVGFEHQPRDDAEHKQVRQAVAQLRRASQLLELPATAGCRLDTADIASALLVDRAEGNHEPAEHRGGAHADEDPMHAEEGEGHSDFDVTYRFECAKPAALDAIGVRLFNHFPNMAHIEAQFAGPAGQGATKLTAKDYILRLR